ncbi:hypothetical protein LSH36_1024g00012, partial [Paralvinella palmiformis]
LNIESLLGLGKVLLFESSPVPRFLLTYKLSQDHFELLFSAVRQFGSWNNNSSAIQFSNAFRSLLSHTGVSIQYSGKANCLSQDTTSLLNLDNTDDIKPFLTFENTM